MIFLGRKERDRMQAQLIEAMAQRQAAEKRADDAEAKLCQVRTAYCSFCGKSQHDVRKLIAGPAVFICDACVDLCVDILKEEIAAHGGRQAEQFVTAGSKP